MINSISRTPRPRLKRVKMQQNLIKLLRVVVSLRFHFLDHGWFGYGWWEIGSA